MDQMDEMEEEKYAEDCESETEEVIEEPHNTSSNTDFIDPDIVATIAALGSYEGDNYVKGDECAICIVDMIKFLRIEDRKTCDIRRQIAVSKTMEKDLLPILMNYFEDSAILDALMRLFVNLTMPAMLCFEKEEQSTKRDKFHEKLFLDVNNYLRWYKDLFVEFNVMKVFSNQLGHLLQLGKSNRTDEDDLMLERVLIIIRNILHVPSDSLQEQDLHSSISTHDKLVMSIDEYGVVDLLFYLCGNKEEEQHCLLSLEIINLIFKDFEADSLALQKGSEECYAVDRELQQLKEREEMERQSKRKKQNTRHSRFGGTFIVKGQKSITDRDLIYHKNIKKINNLSFDEEKNIQRHTGFNSIARDNSSKRKSTAKIRCALRDIASKFLDLCYNPLMQKTKSFLCRGQSTSDCDESYYLWSCSFFMEFNRKVGFKLQLVAETLSSDTFAYILQVIFRFHEDIKGYSAKMLDQQKNAGQRLHFAIKAYKEILQNLSLMVTSHDNKIKDISGIIQNIIFYQQEYRELPTLLLKQFKPQVFTRSYLIDLIECTHLYIRMLDAYTKQNTLIVQQTKKKPKKKSKVKKKKNLLSEREMLEMWDGDIEKDVLAILSAGNISTSKAQPFDASSDYSMEQQRVLCKHEIQDLLKSGSITEAVSLYKAAQEVWPSSPSFGMPDMAVIDELNVMKSIFLSREDIAEVMSVQNDDEVTMSNEHEYNTEIHTVSEHKFQSTDYLMLYARPGIVKCYCYLLEFFETNSASTNHAVVKMLYRVAGKIAMVPLMFQISFFVTLKRILSAPKIDAYKDLQKFAAFIVRRFITSLKETPLVCIDAIFWKTTDDVMAIEHGYDTEKFKQNEKQKVEWSPQEEEELKSLFEKWVEKARSVDLCDMIVQDMTTSTDKHRMDVKKKIIELKLVGEENVDILKRRPKSKKEWLSDEHEALKHLYSEFMYERDPVALIQEKLDTKTRKMIIKELESFLGVKKVDLDVNRSIWSKDDDEELRILYEHKSETLNGNALVECIQEHLPKNRTVKEIKDALKRLQLQKDDGNPLHFWTALDLEVITKYEALSSKKEMVQKIRADIGDIDAGSVIQQLIRMEKMTTKEGASLLLELNDSDSEVSDEEGEEEEYDFFDFSKYVKRLRTEHSSALKWITDVCQKAINCREDLLDYDTVYIVPKDEKQHTALRDSDFKAMLHCLGAMPPLSSYETFWKITSDVSDNILNSAHSILRGDVDEINSSDNGDESVLNVKELSHREGEEEEAAHYSSDDDMDKFLDFLRQKPPKSATDDFSEGVLGHVTGDDGPDEKKLVSESQDGNTSDKENDFGDSAPKRKKVVFSDSDSEVETPPTLKKKRTAVISDSDE